MIVLMLVMLVMVVAVAVGGHVVELDVLGVGAVVADEPRLVDGDGGVDADEERADVAEDVRGLVEDEDAPHEGPDDADVVGDGDAARDAGAQRGREERLRDEGDDADEGDVEPRRAVRHLEALEHRLSQLMITVWCTALPILRVITYAVADPTHPSTPNSAPTVRRHTGVSTPQYSDSD